MHYFESGTLLSLFLSDKELLIQNSRNFNLLKENFVPMDVSEATQKFKEYLQINQTSLKMGSSRHLFDLNNIRHFSKELAQMLLSDPMALIPWFEEELKNEYDISHCGFFGSFGLNNLTPGGLSTRVISKMICLEGIVTSVSLVRPKIQRSVHFCENINQFYVKDYRDSTMITKLPPTNTIFPLKDSNSNPLNSEFGLSKYMDFQTINLQEMPEKCIPGSIPRSVECILTDDLVDLVKPGDRIKIVGIFKSFSHGGVLFPNRFRTVLIDHIIL